MFKHFYVLLAFLSLCAASMAQPNAPDIVVSKDGKGQFASIQEAVLSVRDIVHLGTHDMFIATVTNVIADDAYIDPATGALDLAKAKLISYCHGHYYTMGSPIGKFGSQLQGSEEERNGFLYETALLVMVPELLLLHLN